MNKKLVVLGGSCAFLLLIVVVSVLIKGQSADVAACNKFIKYVEAGDTADSYKLFSPGAASLISQQGWQNQVANLRSAYGASAKLTKTKESTSLNPSSGAKQAEVDYSLKGVSRTFAVQCNTIQSDKDILIDSFTSNVAVQ